MLLVEWIAIGVVAFMNDDGNGVGFAVVYLAVLVPVAASHHGIDSLRTVFVHLVDGVVGGSDEYAQADVEVLVATWTKERVVPSEVYGVYHLLHGLFALVVERLVGLVEWAESSLVVELLEQLYECFLLDLLDAVVVVVVVRHYGRVEGHFPLLDA